MRGRSLRNQVVVLLGAVSMGLLAVPTAHSLHLASDKGLTAGAILRGEVKGPSGEVLEGVPVSARADGETITTSVYTNEAGSYEFPPLHEGNYRVWAQAVGFEAAQRQAQIGRSGPVQLPFSLKQLADFTRQLSAQEWLAALPEDTAANRRMKIVFRNNCSGCHPASYVLQNRFDEEGWKRIITYMEKTDANGGRPAPDAPLYNPMIRYFKDDLAAYLARMRGPGPSPMKFQPFPRPRGEAARVVVTEFDIPGWETGQPVIQNGSIWSEGTPSLQESRAPHDAVVDANGIVWIAANDHDRTENERTVIRLDPRTGETKNYQVRNPHRGRAMNSHGIVVDQKGVLWFNAGGGLGKLDPKTDKPEWIEPPRGMSGVGGTLDVDPAGNVWISANVGALRYDPATGKFTEFRSLDRRAGTYGVAADSEGNGWWAQLTIDTVNKSDIQTGKSEPVVLNPVPLDIPISAEERKVYELSGAANNVGPPGSQGPRRLSGDKNGNTVWVANFLGDNLARIDIRTKRVTHYPLPGASPYQLYGLYDTVVDKKGVVWANLQNCDCVGKFDPKTEQWTLYPLPTRGTESRFIDVDNYKDAVEVWIPYWRTNKMARMQFRAQ